MKKVPFIIALSFAFIVIFVMAVFNTSRYEMIKFPEPQGQILGVIEHDFDGNGHWRYISRDEFLRRGLTEDDCKIIFIESTENAYYWINRLRGSRDESGYIAIWISKLEAVHFTKLLWGHPDDTIYSSGYRDYDYKEVPEGDIRVIDLL